MGQRQFLITLDDHDSYKPNRMLEEVTAMVIRDHLGRLFASPPVMNIKVEYIDPRRLS